MSITYSLYWNTFDLWAQSLGTWSEHCSHNIRVVPCFLHRTEQISEILEQDIFVLGVCVLAGAKSASIPGIRLKAAWITPAEKGLQTNWDDGSIDITLGVSLLVTVYWLYGYEYPRKLRKAFSFLECFVLELVESKYASPPAVSLHTLLITGRKMTHFFRLHWLAFL